MAGSVALAGCMVKRICLASYLKQTEASVVSVPNQPKYHAPRLLLLLMKTKRSRKRDINGNMAFLLS
jgi:hypothetical protein